MIRATEAAVAVNEAVLLPATTFSLENSRALAITGPNGSGKTTLLRALAGLVQPTSGSVAIAGRPVDESDAAFRALVAALVYLPPVARNLTVEEHLRLVLASWGWQEPNIEGDVAKQLKALQIDHLARRFPHELSAGQNQLFALALTLIRPAKVLLLDEPERHLDTEHRELVQTVLAQRKMNGTTIAFATHEAMLINELADSVLDIAVFDGGPDSV